MLTDDHCGIKPSLFYKYLVFGHAHRPVFYLKQTFQRQNPVSETFRFK
jgi:hypothetical protein